MSTRYVWERYNTLESYEDVTDEVSAPLTITLNGLSAYANYTFNEDIQRFVPSRGRGGEVLSSPYMDADEYPYLFPQYNTNSTIMYENTNVGKYITWQPMNNYTAIQLYNSSPNMYYDTITRHTVQLVSNKGSFYDYVSSVNSYTYPNDAITGSYWYTYQGSDSIDPVSVSIPSSINGGEQCTITVSPSTSKVYEGTVNYTYYYRLDDGSWTTITTTSSESTSFIVPTGSDDQTLQVRVRAQDTIGFVSNDYVVSNIATVVNNAHPTAPSSIGATNVVMNQNATVTWTAASDSDGTIASYTLQRKINGGSFTTIYTGTNVSYSDAIGDWATVQYQVQATDNDGATSDWTQSTSYTVQEGILIINGPSYEMGSQPISFTFQFTLGISGVSQSVTDVTTTVTLDSVNVYSGTPDVGETVSLNIDTRFLNSGTHTLIVSTSKSGYTGTSGTYTFTVPYIDIPDGGYIQRLENSQGQTIYPVTLARCVVTEEGQDVVSLLSETLQLLNAILGVDTK